MLWMFCFGLGLHLWGWGRTLMTGSMSYREPQIVEIERFEVLMVRAFFLGFIVANVLDIALSND